MNNITARLRGITIKVNIRDCDDEFLREKLTLKASQRGFFALAYPPWPNMNYKPANKTTTH